MKLVFDCYKKKLKWSVNIRDYPKLFCSEAAEDLQIFCCKPVNCSTIGPSREVQDRFKFVKGTYGRIVNSHVDVGITTKQKNCRPI